MSQRVFIIGAGGMVGATAASVLAMQEVVGEIFLIDIAEKLVHGQAMDISHATAYTNGVRVKVGEYSDIQRDDIIIITCGIAQAPGQSRLDLLTTNADIIKDVVRKVMAAGQEVFILMVTNPVDVLTYVALKESGLPKNRVFGTGTTLDTARLKVLLAQELHVSQQELDAYVLGEHGDSSFVATSGARAGGVPLTSFPSFKPERMASISQDIRNTVYEINEAKKSTYYGIGQVISQLVKALQQGPGSIFPVCSLVNGEYGLDDVVIGLPSLVSDKGVVILDNYPLNKKENQDLRTSAEVIKKAIKNVN